MKKSLCHALIFTCAFMFLSGCGDSDYEEAILIEDTYNEGYWDALDCVKRKGGAAYDAARDCEDE